jgi:hypothetical protein
MWYNEAMPKRSSKPKSQDVNVLAASIVEEATKAGKDPLAVELGRRGGLKGGVARAKKLTPEQRQEIARRAARARWEKKSL